ncbi:MAG: clan AA aspartic protease, partial [Burkholderiales bacterium]|nr:clan AA aspartic protease [Burkholderiales bacterium]
MGLVYAKIRLGNPANPHLEPLEAKALVDSGAVHLCIPEHVALQLQLRELEQREVITADGKRHLCAYVGPVSIEYRGRHCFTGALVLGDGVLLGSIPMEDMDLVVDPGRRMLT